MKKVATAYLIAPVRGRRGDLVTPEEKQKNVDAAIAIGRTIRLKIPQLDLFIPHEHEEIVDALWRHGLSTEHILVATCYIACRKDFAVAYTGNGISDGMHKEIWAVNQANKTTVCIAAVTEEAIEAICEETAKHIASGAASTLSG